MNTEIPPPDEETLRKLRNVTLAGYALQALSFFLGGIPAVIAVVLAYVKRDDARGTWLESHLRWQIRTFWFALLGAIVGFATFIILIGWVILCATAVWVIYRIVKGWLALNDGKPLPA